MGWAVEGVSEYSACFGANPGAEEVATQSLRYLASASRLVNSRFATLYGPNCLDRRQPLHNRAHWVVHLHRQTDAPGTSVADYAFAESNALCRAT